MTTTSERLVTLEHRLTSLQRENRRWRLGALALVAPLLAVGGLAAMQNARVPEVIRTNRLEIVDAHGKVVMAAATTAGEGRLDLWNARGANVVRLGCNPDGGDIILWNSAGRNVAGLFASGDGASAELRANDGSASLALRSVNAGSMIALATGPDSRESVSLKANANESSIAVLQGGTLMGVSLGASEAGGSVALTDFEGRRLATVSSDPNGGRVDVQHPTGGSASLSLGSEGGVVAISDRMGKRVAELQATADGGSLLSLYEGARKLVGLGASQGGGLLNLADAQARTVLVAGPASDADGGAVSIRSGAGIQIARVGVDILGAGEVAVFNGEGTSKRVLGMGIR
ncbi:MAG: hypothetical protein O2819_06085 [Planctomycetota bacterium]|nr:hypothetical protein [Planctomycetota bacterium]MDA1106418.1 hypothetical protein [Planctomycetota bacterium]